MNLDKQIRKIVIVLLFSLTHISKVQADCTSVFTAFYLTEKEISIYKTQALMGDCEATFKLTDYYVFLTSDEESTYFWLLIGAENGCSALQIHSAYNMLFDGNIRVRDRKERSVYWIEKSGIKDMSAFKELWLKNFGDNQVKEENIEYSWENKQVPLSRLPENIINHIKHNVLLGKENNSYKLYSYYLNDKKDKEEAVYWLRIGAQNENTKCQYEYGQYLLTSDKEDDRIRGRFWIRKAAKNGYKEAEEIVKKIKENEE